jgi:PKD repeat protein
MKIVTRSLIVVLLSLAAQVSVGTPAKTAQKEAVGNGYDREARARLQQSRFQKLWSEKVPVSGPAVSVRLNDEEARGLSGRTEGLPVKSPLELRQRVGAVKTVAYQVDFAGVKAGELPAASAPAAGGALAAHSGGMTWTTMIEAVDATAMRLRFSGLRLPPNASLFIFNDEGQVDGPYTGTHAGNAGGFWSSTIPGQRAYVQLAFDGQPSQDDLRATGFTVSDVAFIGPVFQIIEIWNSCRSNPACVMPGVPAGSLADHALTGIAHLQFVSGSSVYICSGGLVADTDPSTERNYLLTANHCISRATEAASLESFFLYTECGSNSTMPPSAIPTGAQILASARKSDFTLLELNGSAPDGTTRLGWDANTNVARSNGMNLYRISHPNGAPQSYSEHKVDITRPTCRSWPRGAWIYSSDSLGATTGGSSGSPVLNGAGQIVGQLSGACGYNVQNSCDTAANATVDGALADYFNKVSAWLAPVPASPGNQDPIADFSVTTSGLTGTFIDGSYDPDPDGGIDQWLWDFGDPGSEIDTSTESDPAYTYPESGTYTVSLTVTDNLGATGTRTASVTVSDGSTQPGSVAVAAVDASATCDNRGGKWIASFSISLDQALQNATIYGDWGGRARGSASCVTDASGTCSVSKRNLKSGGETQFTVTDVQLAGYSFAASANDSAALPYPGCP